MKKLKFIVVLLAALGFAAVQARAGKVLYYLEPVHSSLEFSVPFMGVAKVSGRFNHYFGKAMYDEENPANSSVEVFIRAASVDTDHQRRDGDLRSPAFFDAAKYSVLTFKSSRILARDDGFAAIGTFSMHGVSKEIEIPFRFVGKHVDPEKPERNEMGIEATLSIDRKDYNMKGGLVSGSRMFVGAEVELRLFARFRRVKKEQLELIEKNPAVSMAPERMASLAGAYSSADGTVDLVLEPLAGRMTARMEGTMFSLVPIGPSAFRFEDLSALARLDDPEGKTLTYDRWDKDPVKLVRNEE